MLSVMSWEPIAHLWVFLLVSSATPLSSAILTPLVQFVLVGGMKGWMICNSYLGNTYKGYLQFPKGTSHCIFDAPKQDFPGKPERIIYLTDVF